MSIGQTNPEILIVGGGVIGLSIARELHKRGAGSIRVVDQGTCGRGASWAAAGMLTPQSEADEEGPFLKLCSESRDLYPQFAEELLEETGIDVELDRTGTLAVAFDDADARELEERYQRQRDLSLTVESLTRQELLSREPHLSRDLSMGLFFPNDWQVENRKLVEALQRYAVLNGIELIENITVGSLSIKKGRVTGAVTSAGVINAGCTVIATGAWTSLIKLGDAPLPLSVVPVRGQMIVLEPNGHTLDYVVHSRRGYIVPRRDGRLWVGSTTEHVGFDAAVSDEAWRTLSDAARDMLPCLDGAEIVDHWAGLRPFAADGLPILGEIEGVDGLFVATGHYRNGILLAPLTAKLSAEFLLDERASRYFDEFGISRFQARRAGSGN